MSQKQGFSLPLSISIIAVSADLENFTPTHRAKYKKYIIFSECLSDTPFCILKSSHE